MTAEQRAGRARNLANLEFLAEREAEHLAQFVRVRGTQHPKTLDAKARLARTMKLVRRLNPPPWRAAEVSP